MYPWDTSVKQQIYETVGPSQWMTCEDTILANEQSRSMKAIMFYDRTVIKEEILGLRPLNCWCKDLSNVDGPDDRRVNV